MTENEKKNIAVLLSGRGSNFEALLKATNQSDYPAKIVAVVSDKPNAPGLDIAKDAHIATASFDRKDFLSKTAHEAAIIQFFTDAKIDLICLAGYMRLLSPHFLQSFPERILNIHPSLLPKYPGLDTHKRALESGDSEHGCSVHLVDAGMDTGPILAQAKVDILKDDTPEKLAKRVLAQEHKLYSQAVKTHIENNL